jgi:hypothetical protein
VRIASDRNAPPETLADTAPHPDARDLEFLDNTTLLETDDGGISFSPIHQRRRELLAVSQAAIWALQVYSVAYDTTNHVMTAGLQTAGRPD